MKEKNSPVILAITYGAHDTAAALMMGGELVAACIQERFNLEKHSRAFPRDAINACLKKAGIAVHDVDYFAFPTDYNHYIRETYLKPALNDSRRIGFLINDIERIKRAYGMTEIIREQTGYKGEIGFYRHHLCHIASAYYPSGFQEALCVSHDGIGEIDASMLAAGERGDIRVLFNQNNYPHSLGLLYSAATYFLGWKHHCDEGIVMGLAPYGNPNAVVQGRNKTYYSFFEDILRETGDYSFEVNQDWMAYYYVRDKWISNKFIEVFGQPRQPGSEIHDHHRHIAAALQKRMEDVVLNQLKKARKEFGFSKLCIAGGVGLNCSLNGKIEASGLFDEIFVQPASGDDGVAVGACYLAHRKLTGELQPKKMHDFYKGSFADPKEAVEASGLAFQKLENLYAAVADRLKRGKIVGWFQGGSEFGPRALGNRSILAKPYPAEMKDHINARVKFREPFRPFAPAVIGEKTRDYFQIKQESPHMLIAAQVKPEKKDRIPAVVHVDGTCRVQTVYEHNNPRFYKLLEAFYLLTDVPVLLNTSFNVKGQPIVDTPQQAIETYKSTKIDCLVVGDYFTEKPDEAGL